MNKNVLIGGGVALVAVIALIIYMMQMPAATVVPDPVATSTGTVVTPGDTTPVPTPIGEVVTPLAPLATTNTTVSPTNTTAVVTGTVVPNGAMTSYWYEYGISSALGKTTAHQNAGSGSVSIPAPGYISGLVKNTTYYFRIVAQNSVGSVSGDQHTFTTSENTPAPVGSAPSATTGSASGITAIAATLKGQVNPHQASTQYWFEIGKTTNLGHVTSFVSVGSGSALVDAGATVPGLEAGTTYYYRLNAQNQFGTVNGSIQTFKTTGKQADVAPVVTTQVTSMITNKGAQVNGTVNPSGTQTSYWFEYGTNATLPQNAVTSTNRQNGGGVSTTVSVQSSLKNLASKTTYYVRIVAQSNAGTVRGDIQSFTTL